MGFSYLLSTVAGVCGSLFLGYCVYFDRKRHSDPDFKKKLHERRNPKTVNKKEDVLRFPNLDDDLACSSFFTAELGKASKCFDEEKFDEAIGHVANSLVVFDDEEQRNCLILVLQDKYTPSFMHAIIQGIPEAEKRLRDYQDRVQKLEEESEITTRFPCTTNMDAIYNFVTDEVALAKECVEDDDIRGAAYHYANVVVIVDENERQQILNQLRRGLGNDFLSLIMQATGPAQQRLRGKLLQEDQELALKFLLCLSLLHLFVSNISR